VSGCTYQNTMRSVRKNFTLVDRNSSPRALVRVQPALGSAGQQGQFTLLAGPQHRCSVYTRPLRSKG